MRRTKTLLLLLPITALAACATPREACINDARSNLRTLMALADQTERNIARGYAIAEVQDVRTLRKSCTGTTEDGDTFTFPCEETETFDREIPVAINIAEERAKLASIRERIAQEQIMVNSAVQRCVAVYPE